MGCAERALLLRNYRFEIRRYFAAVDSLNELKASTDNNEFLCIWDLAQERRLMCDTALRRLRLHTEQHRCEPVEHTELSVSV